MMASYSKQLAEKMAILLLPLSSPSLLKAFPSRWEVEASSPYVFMWYCPSASGVPQHTPSWPAAFNPCLKHSRRVWLKLCHYKIPKIGEYLWQTFRNWPDALSIAKDVVPSESLTISFVSLGLVERLQRAILTLHSVYNVSRFSCLGLEMEFLGVPMKCSKKSLNCCCFWWLLCELKIHALAFQKHETAQSAEKLFIIWKSRKGKYTKATQSDFLSA